MPKAVKGSKFYAVNAGRVPGVYATWDECKRQTDGFPGAKFKSFATAAEATAFALPGSAFTTVQGPESAASSSMNVKTLSTTKERTKEPYERKTIKGASSFNAFASQEVDETGWDVVYTDGACKNNQGGAGSKRAGVGVWWGPNDERNIAVRCPGEQTNNRAELLAIILALETTPRTKTPLMIKTDSKYCIECFQTWMHTWVKHGWKTSDGKIPANLALIRYASALLDERAYAGQKVRLVHVRGHVGVEGNEGADGLANKGCWLSEIDKERNWKVLEKEVRNRMNGKPENVEVSTLEVTGGGEVEVEQVEAKAS